jgi:transcriptional regulator with XRE-family HTH domain
MSVKRTANKKGGKLTVSATLRRAIRDSGQTLYRVAKDSGVPYATLHRFMNGKTEVSMASLDKLCAYLGLALTPGG